MKFKEIFTDYNEPKRAYGGEIDPYDGFVISVSFPLWGIPEDIPFEEEDSILSGAFEGAVSIGEASGLLIVGSQAKKSGLDLYEVCDAASGYAEFVYSALSESKGPLSEWNNPYCDFFCIEDIELKKEFDSEDVKSLVLKSLPSLIFQCYHIFLDFMADYIKPLPFKENKYTIIKKDIAQIAMSEWQEDLESDLNNEPRKKRKYHLMLDEEQSNYIMGKRNKNETYPESAKDRKVWDFYFRNGFVEHSDTRIVYRMTDSLDEEDPDDDF